MAAARKYLGYSTNDTDEQHWQQANDVTLKVKLEMLTDLNNKQRRALNRILTGIYEPVDRSKQRFW